MTAVAVLLTIYSGGKAESIHSRKGQSLVQLADDQLAQDKSVCALLTTYRLQRPLVLLIDDKYTLFPYDLSTKDVTYAVLGLYTITHVWGWSVHWMLCLVCANEKDIS